MSITSVPIRATITLGTLTIATPYIQSFNVKRVRNSKATFSASLKIPAEDLSDTIGNEIVIEAGVSGDEKKIFTGFVLSSRPSLCFDDPSYVVLNVSGADALFKLENQFFTRRVINTQAKWGIIDGVIRKAGRGERFQLTNDTVQVVDPDIIDALENQNQNDVSPSLMSLGTEQVRATPMSIAFKFGSVTNTSD